MCARPRHNLHYTVRGTLSAWPSKVAQEMATVIPKHAGEIPAHLSRTMWVANWSLIIGPFVAFWAGLWFFWRGGVILWPILCLVITYVVIAPGATVGLHRYFTHKSFKAKKSVRIGLGVLGEMAIEGPIIKWIPEHRMHHRFSDTDLDLHSPMRGFKFAHIGWFFAGRSADQQIYARDLLDDPIVVWLDSQFGWFILLSLVGLPLLLGTLPGLFAWDTERMFWEGVQTVIWAGLVRVMLIHHVTWSVNSICHMYGTREFKTPTNDTSGNVWWLWVFSLGESWHRFHHAIEWSALHGHGWWDDPSYAIILVLKKFGLVWDVRVPSTKLIATKRICS